MVRFTGAEPVVFVIAIGCDCSRTFRHLAFCACAIFNREAFDIKRFGAGTVPVGWLVVLDAPEPFSDVSSEIA
jgi:hypothetical protein